MELLERENFPLLVVREKLSSKLEKVERAKIAREQLQGGGVYQVEGGILQVSN